ncbi:glycosyltransferase family 2 protein [Paenibacillus sepulcri]|uniref:Glycosyltransferase family 2 protein n=1 Tax=Paenibacillus sepulcri TaxID=359917 RepID=A0ABS7C2U9_9BACL|nr:glycosyltransferase family 2 protein [Paenibacillus sepulcri]
MSVIIPTYNAGPAFDGLLGLLQSQTLTPHEIIVVDSSSSDGTAERARRAGARVFTILQSEFDHGGTRNYAVSLAAGDIYVFMTQDALPDNEFLLQELVRPFQDGKISCVYARQLARPEANVLERLSRGFNYPEQSSTKDKTDIPRLGIKTFFCSNVCAAIRKDVFMEVGRFPEPVIFNEDLFFAAKCILQGYTVAYAAEARVVHSHDYTLIQQFRRFFDNGVSMRNNDWVFQYSAVGKEGSRLVRTQLSELHRQRKWHWMPRLFAESAAKLLGYQLGKRYRSLPNGLCVRFSMHRKIWDKLNAESGVKGKGMSV